MDTDSRANAEQPRLTREVKAFAGVCISVYLCLSVVSSFQLPFLGLWLRGKMRQLNYQVAREQLRLLARPEGF